MSETASNSKVFMAGLVVGLIIAFLVAGAFTFGFSAEVRDRAWHDLLERPSHLFRFRFILQPVMAGLAALHDGIADARMGRTPYFWALVTRSSRLLGRLEEGVISTDRVLLLGLVMDTIYQLSAQDILSRGGSHCGNSARVYSVSTFARPNHAVRPLSTRGKARLMKSDDALFERQMETKLTRPRSAKGSPKHGVYQYGKFKH